MKKYFFSFVAILTLGMLTFTNHINNMQIIETGNLYFVGDSLSDTGTLHGIIKQLNQSKMIKFYKWLKNLNFGEIKMLDPLSNNSICNGDVFTKKIADQYKKPLTSGWRFKVAKIFNFEKKGNNYAVIGAQATKRGDELGQLLNLVRINKQVDALLSQHKITKQDVIIFEIGANDVMYALQKKQVTQNKILNKAIIKITKALKKLIAANPKTIIVLNVPPLELTPYFHKLNKQFVRQKVNYFNDSLMKKINKLNKKHNKIIEVFDTNKKMQESIKNFAAANNLANTTDAATTINYNDLLKKNSLEPQYNISNKNDLKHYYWLDNWHPTKTAHDDLATDLDKNYLKDCI